MNEQRLAEIKARLDAATQAPWFAGGNPYEVQSHYRDSVCQCGQEWVVTDVGVQHTSIYTDAEFIAHAPVDVADLLAEVDRLREALTVIRDVLPYVHDGGECETCMEMRGTARLALEAVR